MELEGKYLISGRIAEQVFLLQELAGFVREKPSKKHITDTYFDTAQRILGNAGGGYRLRQVAGKKEITFKQRKGFFDHAHIMKEVSSNLPAEIEFDIRKEYPKLSAVATAREFFRNEPLMPVLTVINDRTDLCFVNPPGTRVVVSLDEVTYMGIRGQFHERELEAEFKEGNKDDFQDFLRAIEKQYSLKPVLLGKYERGLKLVDYKD